MCVQARLDTADRLLPVDAAIAVRQCTLELPWDGEEAPGLLANSFTAIDRAVRNFGTGATFRDRAPVHLAHDMPIAKANFDRAEKMEEEKICKMLTNSMYALDSAQKQAEGMYLALLNNCAQVRACSLI